MLERIRVGTRSSKLAIKQIEEVKNRLAHIDFDMVYIKTKGDKDKITPLADCKQQDFFTYEIEKALLEGSVDVAVHSAKDLEETPPRQLVIAAMTNSISPFECLVSRGNLKLRELPSGSVIGTSSRKRQDAIINFRSDLIVKNIRGDIDERINQLDKGAYDAIIVAHAALLRLGCNERIAEIIPQDIIESHPLQGRLAIQALRDRQDIIELFRSIDER